MASGSIETRTTAKGERRFRARIDVGRSPSTGKRQFRTRTFRTRKAAEKWLRSIGNKLDEGSFIQPSTEPLRAFLAHWLATRTDLEPRTVASYDGRIRLQINPELGEIALGALTGHDIQRLYNQHAGSGQIHIIRTVLHQALDQAVHEGLISRNPCLGLMARGSGREPGDQLVWDARQLALFLDTARDDRFGVLFHVLAATGLRSGEARALVWREVDLAGRVITISGKAKTRAGRRRVTIDPGTAALLSEHRDSQKARLTALDMLVTENMLVFDRGDGEAVHSSTLARHMDAIIARLRLPRLTIHGLRHCHASLLLADGRPPHYMQRRLGHASVVTTLRYYAHVLPTDDFEDAELYGEIMHGVRESG